MATQPRTTMAFALFACIDTLHGVLCVCRVCRRATANAFLFYNLVCCSRWSLFFLVVVIPYFVHASWVWDLMVARTTVSCSRLPLPISLSAVRRFCSSLSCHLHHRIDKFSIYMCIFEKVLRRRTTKNVQNCICNVQSECLAIAVASTSPRTHKHQMIYVCSAAKWKSWSK